MNGYFATSGRLAVLIVLCGAAVGLAAEMPDSQHWTASMEPPAQAPLQQGQATEQMVAGRVGVRLASSTKQHIDLSRRFSADSFNDSFTIRVVFRLTRSPKTKCPLVSKWQMTGGGRSFELGVFPGGVVFFDVSATGDWDATGRELLSTSLLSPNQGYCLAVVFESKQQIEIFVNGHSIGALTGSVPERPCANSTPLWLGAQPPGIRHIDALVSDVMVDNRTLTADELVAWARSLGLTQPPTRIESPMRDGKLDLATVRQQVLAYCQELQVVGQPCGVYRTRRGSDASISLYASADVAWIRACMGEDLRQTLSRKQRREWINHINSFAREDGSYYCSKSGHSLQHANGMVVGALAVLGGRQPHRVTLYDEFNTMDRIVPWLESIHWERQWGASHLFWGGMHCYSLSAACQPSWREGVFEWLDQNLDPKTGWWRKGVPQAGRRIEVLGGAAHIWPIYQHHGHAFPYPKQIIDEILALQQADGSWISFCSYMELDALYGLAYMRSIVPRYRTADIDRAVQRHGEGLVERYATFLMRNPTAHQLLACVGTIGLLQQLAPADYPDTVQWSDIFSDRRFYRTDQVEAVSFP